MSAAFAAAQKRPEVAAEYLLAFVRGDEDDPDAPYVGALLIAEFLHLVRSLGTSK